MAVIFNAYPQPGCGGELACALTKLYARKGIAVSRADVIAWSCCGELYLSHLLCGLSLMDMRAGQYAAKEEHGSILLDCSDYDVLYSFLAGSADAVGVCLHLPDAEGNLHETWVERQLVLEMFDFCRDGIG